MKYLIYTDLHLSYNSSILPLSLTDTKYTTRLDMCVNTMKWIFEIAEKDNVDMIVCGGDIFDSHMLRAEEITAMTDALSYYSDKVPMIIITGNHDILDKSAKFYSSAFFNNYPGIEVYNSPQKINDELSVLPYMSFEDITDELLDSIKNKILVSHIDIYGSKLGNNYELDFGVAADKFSNFSRVFNGHIHTRQELSNKVMNIGSCVSHSFSDDNSYEPSIIVYDSLDDSITTYINPYAILFRTIEGEQELDNFLSIVGSYMNKFVLRIYTDNKKEVEKKLKDYSSSIVGSRIITNSISNSSVDQGESTEKIEINYDNLVEQFTEFLSSKEELKYPLQDYLDILHNMN